MPPLIVAIDGPAGAGKSTVARALAQRFGLLNLESGAMYRAFALKALAAGVATGDAAALDALAIAGKAGTVLTGFTKVETALEKGEVAALLHAAEAAADGKRKLEAVWRRRQPDRLLAIMTFFTSAQLDLALHRPNVVHAAVLAGPASETFLARCQRLERFRTGDQHIQGQGAARIQPAEDAGVYGNGRV